MLLKLIRAWLKCPQLGITYGDLARKTLLVHFPEKQVIIDKFYPSRR